MKTILFLQQKISRFYINMILLTIILFIYEFQRADAKKTIIGAAVFGVVLIINLVLYYRKYHKNWNHYMMLKSMSLLLMAFISTMSVGLIRFSISLFLFLIIVELYIGVVNNHKTFLKVLFALVAVTIGLICIIEILNGGGPIEVAIMSFIVLIFIYCFYLILKDYREDMMAKVKLQTRLFREAAKTNEELRLSQNKFKKSMMKLRIRKLNFYLQIKN